MRAQAGATLIEVLITVLVLSVGLLGLGATQMLSLKNGNNAQQAYYATMVAYDIAERMRANPVGVSAGNYNAADVDQDRTEQSCAAVCTSAQLANMDLYEWGQLLSETLPAGQGAVAVNAGQATITVNWTAQHTGANLSDESGVADQKTFVLVADL